MAGEETNQPCPETSRRDRKVIGRKGRRRGRHQRPYEKVGNKSPPSTDGWREGQSTSSGGGDRQNIIFKGRIVSPQRGRGTSSAKKWPGNYNPREIVVRGRENSPKRRTLEKEDHRGRTCRAKGHYPFPEGKEGDYRPSTPRHGGVSVYTGETGSGAVEENVGRREGGGGGQRGNPVVKRSAFLG